MASQSRHKAGCQVSCSLHSQTGMHLQCIYAVSCACLLQSWPYVFTACRCTTTLRRRRAALLLWNLILTHKEPSMLWWRLCWWLSRSSTSVWLYMCKHCSSTHKGCICVYNSSAIACISIAALSEIRAGLMSIKVLIMLAHCIMWNACLIECCSVRAMQSTVEQFTVVLWRCSLCKIFKSLEDLATSYGPCTRIHDTAHADAIAR